MPSADTQRVRVVAQDPTVRDPRTGRILTGIVSFPDEDLEPGPTGHRVHVVDYDSTSQTMYAPTILRRPTARPSDTTIVEDPAFHAQHVYGVVMATIARFERALGRRVAWGFGSHQIKVVPHAFGVANAFYSRDAEALLFGYFWRDGAPVFTCLSHDVVVHETTHALLDGLRHRFLRPSSPDQAAFHEGFADVVALLSVLAIPEVPDRLLESALERTLSDPRVDLPDRRDLPAELLPVEVVRPDVITQSAMFGLAEQLAADGGDRIGALRRSVTMAPDPTVLQQPEFRESHRRGEVFVAAVMQTFTRIWTARLAALAPQSGPYLDRARAAEEGSDIAEALLDTCIRALDYTPPVHLEFGDFLSAALTADGDLRRGEDRYDIARTLRECFAAFGIAPRSAHRSGAWPRANRRIRREGVRLSNAQSDPTEMFRLIWGNRKKLKIPLTAYSNVSDLWPCVRVAADDGLIVRETVALCNQHLRLSATDLPAYGLTPPPGMPPSFAEVELEGGTTIVLDEYGTVKYQISQALPSPNPPTAAKPSAEEASIRAATQRRLDHLWLEGAFGEGKTLRRRFSRLHRLRDHAPTILLGETW
jgi:hypothetical protein